MHFSQVLKQAHAYLPALHLHTCDCKEEEKILEYILSVKPVLMTLEGTANICILHIPPGYSSVNPT